MSALDQLKKLLMQKQAEKQSEPVPTPQNPENYNEKNADEDQTEFKDADADQSDRAINDELENDADKQESESTPSQGDVAKPDEANDEDMPLATDDEAIDKELASSGKQLAGEEERSPASEDEESNEPDESQLTPQELAGASKSDEASQSKLPIAGEQKQSPKPGSSEYYSDLMNRFKAAQQQSNLNHNLNDFGKYANAATLGMRGVQRNPIIEKTMEEEGKRADLPVQQFVQQLQIEGQDPNSPAAQSMRSALASTLGIDPSKLANLNGTQMDSLAKSMGTIVHSQATAKAAMLNAQTKQGQLGVAQQNADTKQNQMKVAQDKLDQDYELKKQQLGIAQQNANTNAERIKVQKELKDLGTTYKKQKDDITRLDKVGKLITGEVASSRSSFGRAANTYQAAEKMETLADTTGGDYDHLSPTQVAELAKNLDAMLSNGQATVSGLNKLIPTSAAGDLAKIENYITNNPDGANQGDFVRQILETTKREKDLAHSQMQKTQGKLLSSFSDLKDHPTMKTILFQNGLPEDLFETMKPQKDKTPPLQTMNKPPKAKHQPGDIVSVKGKTYQVGPDGDSLIPQ